MMVQATEQEVRREITVNAAPERAFAFFTRRFDAWWPRSHHIGRADMDEAIVEPREGGRWYERGTDGSTCEWGEVLTLVHRGFERHRSGGGELRESVGGPGGWGGLLELYSDALGSS